MANAHIRVINCSPERQRVDVRVAGASEGPIDYRDRTEYVSVDTGTTEVVAATDNASEIRETLDLEDGEARTLVVVGGEDAPLAFVTMDDHTSTVDSGRSRVRFFNAVPDSHPLEVRLDEAIDDTNAVLSENIGYGQNGSYRPITAGSHRIELHTDSHEHGSGESHVHTEESTFEPGRAYTLLALPGHRDGEYDLLLLDDAPLAPQQG